MTRKEWDEVLRAYLGWCLERGTPPRCDELASRLRMSPCRLSREFAGATGKQPGECLTDLKLEYAARLLRETDWPINEIARAVGYSARSAFFRQFSRVYGCPPGEYRRRCRVECSADR